MPWCEDCSKFWNPNSLPPDGTCPTCGRVIGEPPDTSVPWHFWLLLGAVVLYLGWRYVQGIGWLVESGYTPAAAGTVLATVVLVTWLTWRWWQSRGGE